MLTRRSLIQRIAGAIAGAVVAKKLPAAPAAPPAAVVAPGAVVLHGAEKVIPSYAGPFLASGWSGILQVGETRVGGLPFTPSAVLVSNGGPLRPLSHDEWYRALPPPHARSSREVKLESVRSLHTWRCICHPRYSFWPLRPDASLEERRAKLELLVCSCGARKDPARLPA